MKCGGLDTTLDSAAGPAALLGTGAKPTPAGARQAALSMWARSVDGASDGSTSKTQPWQM